MRVAFYATMDGVDVALVVVEVKNAIYHDWMIIDGEKGHRRIKSGKKISTWCVI
jgi:hypothetical protein